jgi:hypothetical protein
MGGSIQIRSVLGHGTKVEVCLPAAPLPEKIASSAGRGQAVVLIDDSHANRLAWLAEAKRADRAFAAFASAEAFFANEQMIDRGSAIYVDYFFNGAPVGAAIAKQLLAAGFLMSSSPPATRRKRSRRRRAFAASSERTSRSIRRRFAEQLFHPSRVALPILWSSKLLFFASPRLLPVLTHIQ